MVAKINLVPRGSTVFDKDYRFILGEAQEKQRHFFIEKLVEEVIPLPRRKQKKALRILTGTIASMVSILILLDPTFASASTGYTPTPGELENVATPHSKAGGNMILPPDIMKIIHDLEIAAVIIGVAVAKITICLAGYYRIFRKDKEAKSWTVDILKGLGQILAGPIIIMMIAWTFYQLFSSYEWFISPF